MTTEESQENNSAVGLAGSRLSRAAAYTNAIMRGRYDGNDAPI
jgi:hypothetical protein